MPFCQRLRASETAALLVSTGGAIALRVGAVAIAFAASLVYARALGPDGFGAYSVVIAWATFATVVSGLGISQYAVRHAARAPAMSHRFATWSSTMTTRSGLLAGGLLVAIGVLYSGRSAWHLYLVAAPLPLLNLYATVRRSLMQGHGHAVRSLWPEQLMVPATMLLLVLGLWAATGGLTPMHALVALLVATIGLALVSRAQFRRWIPRDNGLQGASAADDPTLSAARPYLWLGVLIYLNGRLDLLFVGRLLGNADAGVYSVAMRAAELITFVAIAANLVVGPKIARLHHQGDRTAIALLAGRTAAMTTLLAAPLALVFVFWGRTVLSLLFGDQYSTGSAVLAILSAGQLATVALGPAGLTLNMTDHANLSVRAFGYATFVNLALNFLLVPRLGIEGAAIATATSLVTCNVLRWHWALSRTGINTLGWRWGRS